MRGYLRDWYGTDKEPMMPDDPLDGDMSDMEELEATEPGKEFDVRVPLERLWVMGDNRSNSEDSRYHQDLRGNGTIPVQNVVGRVFAVVWPLGRFTLVHRPEVFDQEELKRDPLRRG